MADRMKTKKLLIIILVLALLAVYYIMGTGYLKQHRDNQALVARIEEVRQLLAQIPPAPADLEQRLSAAQGDYTQTQNAFPTPLNTTQIINSLLLLAEETGVKAVPLITQAWTVESVNGYDYAVFRLDLTVSGNFTRVIDFIEGLETNATPTLAIDSLVIEQAVDAEGGESMLFNARLEIIVYARRRRKDRLRCTRP